MAPVLPLPGGGSSRVKGSGRNGMCCGTDLDDTRIYAEGKGRGEAVVARVGRREAALRGVIGEGKARGALCLSQSGGERKISNGALKRKARKIVERDVVAWTRTAGDAIRQTRADSRWKGCLLSVGTEASSWWRV